MHGKAVEKSGGAREKCILNNFTVLKRVYKAVCVSCIFLFIRGLDGFKKVYILESVCADMEGMQNFRR